MAPVALLVPLPVWSQLGAREQIHRTEELVFANGDPLRSLAVGSSGLKVAYLAGSAVALAVAAVGRDRQMA